MATATREARAYGWGVALLFTVIAVTQASLTLLWGDEFFTYYLGQQRSFAGIWHALRLGADPNPPLMHVLNWWSTGLFGNSALAIRLPSILGMALAIGCVWVLLRRYLPPAFCAAGCLALMTTRGFDYTYDARSYTLLLAFSLAALLCWDRSREGSGAWLVGMAAGLALAVSSNYYGVLAWAPVAVGEIVRSRRGGWRPAVWVAMAVAALPLWPYAALIRANLAAYGPHAWNRPQLSMVVDSYLTLVEGLTWPVLGLGIWWLARRGRMRPEATSSSSALFAAVGTLVVLPVIGFVLAAARSAMISPRCVIAVCAGFALAAAFLLHRLVSPRALRIVLAVLVFWVVARQAACGYLLAEQRRGFLAFRDEVERAAAATGAPVAVADTSTTLPLYWYASPGLRVRMVEPVDFDLIHQAEPDDSGEQNLWAGRDGIFPLRIGSPAAVLSPGGGLIVVAESDGWLARLLRGERYRLRPDPVQPSFEQLGGVFTPLIHPTTQLLFAAPARVR